MGLIRAGMVAAAAVMTIWPAHAARWDITPSAAVEEEFTDNVGLVFDSQDRTSDFITTLTPGISVRGSGGRVNLYGDYTFSQLFYARNSEFNSHRQQLNATGVAELWDKVFFIDAGANISNQVANPQAPVSQTAANLDVNTLETRSWNIGPRFLHHFGTWVETTSTIQHTGISTEEPNSANASDGSSNNFGSSFGTVNGSTPLGNSAIDAVTFVAKSGRSFSQYLWTLTAHNITSSSETLPHHNDKLGRLDTTYVVNRQLALHASGGYQIINDNTLTNSLSGPVWSVGTTYRPGPRVTLDIAYNHQYNENFFTYSGTYNVSPRTSIKLTHTETVQTTQQLLAQRQPVLGAGGVFIDPVTGLPVNSLVAPTGLQSGTLLEKFWNLAGTSSSGRNTYSINLYRSSQEFQGTNQTSTQTGVAATYARALTRRLNGNIFANYRVTDTDNGSAAAAAAGAVSGLAPTTADGHSTQIIFGGGLGYTLTPETSLNFLVNYNAFDGGSESTSTHEKSASIALRRTF